MRFRRILCSIATAIWLVALCSAVCPQETTSKKRIAVLEFEDYSGSSVAASKVFGAEAGDVGKGISAELIQKLTSGQRYTIVDQSALKQLVEELKSSEDDRMDAYGRATRIGRILGLDAMIAGAITRFGPDAAQKGSGTGLRGMSTRKSKAYVDITARVLDMTSGQVTAEFTATGESASTGDVIIFKGQGHSKDTQEMLSNEFGDSLLGEATRNAVAKIAGQLNSYAEKIPTLRIEMEGLVAEVSGNMVTLNLGRKSGAKVGDRFAIFQEIPTTTKPQTGEGVPPVMEPIGEVTVTEVADLYAIAAFSGAGQVHVGDRVKRVANSQNPPHQGAEPPE